MNKRSYLPLLLAWACLAVTACGNAAGSPPQAPVRAEQGGGATASGRPGTADQAAPGSPSPHGGSSTPTPTAPSAGSRTASPAGQSAPPLTLTAALGQSCLTPGGRQTLTAQSRPGYTVAFNSAYADGKRGDVHGGYGVYATDSQGRVSVTWTVAQTAPLGGVNVAVGTGNGGAPATQSLSFTLQARC